MKKLLGAVLGLALMIPSGPVSAELLKNLKVDGQLDVLAVSANNVTDFNTGAYDHIGDAQTRLLLNANWDLLDDVHSVVTLRKNDRTYGTGSQTLFGVQTVVFLDQAYFKVDKVFGAIDTTLGRQFYGEQGDAVIYFGPKDYLYGLGVTALDTARFDWNGNWVGVTGLVGKLADPTAQGAGLQSAANSVDLRGLRASFKGNDMLSGSAYLYNQVTHNTGAAGSFAGAGNQPPANKDDYLYVLGAKGKFSMAGAWVKAEVDKNFGQNRPAAAGVFGGAYTGWEFLFDLGYKANIPNVVTLTPWFQFGDGSGGQTANRVFTPIAGDYRPGGIYGLFAPTATTPATLGSATNLGTVSSSSLSDRVIWGLGLKATPAGLAKLTTGIAWYDYHYQTLGDGNALGTPAGANGNKHIGDEVDLNASWAHSDNVSFGVGIGTFQAGGAIANASNSNPATHANNPVFLAEASATVKF